jgi:hypothetical protein
VVFKCRTNTKTANGSVFEDVNNSNELVPNHKDSPLEDTYF